MFKIIIRVDASLKMGIGHVMRCLSLAEQLTINGNIVEFICRNHNGNLIEQIISKGFVVKILEMPFVKEPDDKLQHAKWLGVSQKKDAKDTINFLKETPYDLLIVDHYGIDIEWENKVNDYTKSLFVIDDLADRAHNCNFLLDQTYGKSEEIYKKLVPEKCELMLGSKYAMLRPEFSYWRQSSIKRRKNINLNNILITMGGNDPKNYTTEIIKKIDCCQLSWDTKITVIMGPNSLNIDSVKTIAAASRYNVEVLINVVDMAEIMANADLSIGASGSSTWERCCLGLPAIQICVATNQEISSKILASSNIIKLINSVEEIPNLISTFENWGADCSIKSAKICNGLGTTKVINTILRKYDR
jgi:UDP-2,4-diacetamido-2,4,6-trideoxy-beta-L-altropyranose hydrolase